METVSTIESSQSSADNDDQNPERVTEIKVCQLWNERFQALEKQSKDVHKRIRDGRKFISGIDRETPEGEMEYTRANLIHGDITADVGRVYAKNPEVSASPRQSVHPRQYSVWKEFCKTVEILINFGWDQAKLKPKAKACVRGSRSSRIAWMKVYYHKDLAKDPEVEREIDDAQDNLQTIERLLAELSDPTEIKDQEVKRDELRRNIESLEKELEIVSWEGLSMGRVMPEHILIDTDLIQNFESWDQSPYLIHIIPMWIEDAKRRFNKKFKEGKGGIKFRNPTEGDKKALPSDDNGGGKVIYILEIWDRLSNTIFTVAEGGNEYLKEPFQPDGLGNFRYPFFPLPFGVVDGQFWPLSYYELVQKLQNEHNDIRSMYHDDRENFKPHTIVRSDVDDEDVKQISNPDRYGVSRINGIPGEPIGNYIFQGANFETDPNLANTTHIREDWERTTNIGDSARGFVARAKTATEASFLDDAVQRQSGSQSDEIDDWLTDIAQFTIQTYIFNLNDEQVRRIAGPKAVWVDFLKMHSYWMWLLDQNPETEYTFEQAEQLAEQRRVDLDEFLVKDDILNYINVEIRAGSTGKPNQAQKQKNYIQFVPEIRETMIKVSEMRQQGQHEIADGLIKMVQYGISVFDETIDIEEWFPELVRSEEEANKEKAVQEQREEEEIEAQKEAQQMALAKEEADLQNQLAEVQKKLSEVEENKASAEKLNAEAVQESMLPKFPRQQNEAATIN